MAQVIKTFSMDEEAVDILNKAKAKGFSNSLLIRMLLIKLKENDYVIDDVFTGIDKQDIFTELRVIKSMLKKSDSESAI